MKKKKFILPTDDPIDFPCLPVKQQIKSFFIL